MDYGVIIMTQITTESYKPLTDTDPYRQLYGVYSWTLARRQCQGEEGTKHVHGVEPVVVCDLVRGQGLVAAGVCVELVVVLPLL